MDIQKLKGARVSKGYTQEHIARKLGVSTKTYNRKELGLIEFNRREILKLMEILELDHKDIAEIFLQ